MSHAKEVYREIFDIEMDGWCFGIQRYRGELFPGLMHGVIREMRESFIAAFQYGYVFDLLDLASRISKAGRNVIQEKEAAFSIMAHFPHPSELSEEGQLTMGRVIDQVEQRYGGALERLQRKWNYEKRRTARAA